jgi:hypothetical protein
MDKAQKSSDSEVSNPVLVVDNENAKAKYVD